MHCTALSYIQSGYEKDISYTAVHIRVNSWIELWHMYMYMHAYIDVQKNTIK